MPYSVVKDGKVTDISLKKRSPDRTVVYLGDEFIGTLFKIKNRRWTAIYNQVSDIGFTKVDGFATRMDAVEYLLRLHVYKQ